MKLTTQTDITPERKHDRLRERVQHACALAKQLEKFGDYEAAIKALGEFWLWDTLEIPFKDLDQETLAELLLRNGTLNGWLGSTRQVTSAQEIAKNLITQSIEIFQELKRSQRLAEALSDLGLCYWREGAFEEARITLESALDQVQDENPELKAILLIRAGIIEMDSQRLRESLSLFYKAKPFVEAGQNDSLKGSFHMEFAILFRRLSLPESGAKYIDQALIENSAASFHFEQAGNHRYLARVENNLGFLHYTIGQYPDAHQHLSRARKLFLELDDIGTVAQVDDTRARTMLAEGNLREAERVIKSAVRVLERGGQQALLAEALTTQGTVAARMGNYSRARTLLQRAIDVAETCGDLEAAGRARLSIIEELNKQTQPRELASTFHEAAALLEKSQDVASGRRLLDSSLKTIDALLEERTEETELPADHSWAGFSLKREMKRIEARVIQHALRDAGGSVSKASRMLGFKHHQSLISLLENRHKDLAGLRSVRRQRRRTLISKGQPAKKTSGVLNRDSAKISVLYVEDSKPVARLVEELLRAAGIYVDACASGAGAWETLKSGTHYDALIVDNNLPGLSGLELVLRVRSMRERRHLPIIMLSGDDVEKEAWRAGVDAFLLKPEGVERLPTTIMRALNGRRRK